MARQQAARVKDLRSALDRGTRPAPLPAAARPVGAAASTQGYQTRPEGVATTTTVIRLEAELFDRFKLRCLEKKRSMSHVVEELVGAWMAKG